MAEQSGGKFAPLAPTKRTGHAAFPQDEIATKFASDHANSHNHFNHERHLVERQTYKEMRSAALAEWQNLAT